MTRAARLAPVLDEEASRRLVDGSASLAQHERHDRAINAELAYLHPLEVTPDHVTFLVTLQVTEAAPHRRARDPGQSPVHRDAPRINRRYLVRSRDPSVRALPLQRAYSRGYQRAGVQRTGAYAQPRPVTQCSGNGVAELRVTAALSMHDNGGGPCWAQDDCVFTVPTNGRVATSSGDNRYIHRTPRHPAPSDLNP